MRQRAFTRWIEPGYVDAGGAWHETAPSIAKSLERALGGTGVTCRDGDNPVLFVREGVARRISGVGELILEDGTVRALEGRIASDVPAGYHELRLVPAESSGRPAVRRVRVIVSPGVCTRTPPERVWGFAVQLYGLRSRKSWGIGDLGDLEAFAEFSRRKLGAGALLVNPLNAVAPTLPQQHSPYFPSSRLYENPLYLRVEKVPGARAIGAELERIARTARASNGEALVDRDRVFELKRAALERIFHSFSGSAGFDRFLEREGDFLVRFAAFSALAERYGPSFRAWPPEFRAPSSEAVSRFARKNAKRLRFHQWLQWNLDQQLARAGKQTSLIRDLPIGVDPDGADAWSFPDAFSPGVSIGAPPDAINSEGQNWGLCPFVPWRLAASGFEPFIRTVRAAFRHSGALRVDHVMGLFRLFLIPRGRTPKQGGYVLYPARELLDIIAIESRRANAFVIGEDLGTVARVHRRELRRRGILSYRLVWFERKPPSTYPKGSLAAVTTHDLPTIAGVLSGADRRVRARLGLPVDAEADAAMAKRLYALAACEKGAAVETVISRVHEALARAPSAIVMAAIEDAIASPDRPNMPGVAGAPSFRLALPLSLEELEKHPLLLRFAEILRRQSDSRKYRLRQHPIRSRARTP